MNIQTIPKAQAVQFLFPMESAEDEIKQKVTQMQHMLDILATVHPNNQGLYSAAIDAANEVFGNKAILFAHGWGFPKEWKNPYLVTYTRPRGKKKSRSYDQVVGCVADSPVRVWYVAKHHFIPCCRFFVINKDRDTIQRAFDEAARLLGVTPAALMQVRCIEVTVPDEVGTDAYELIIGLDTAYVEGNRDHLVLPKEENATNH